MASWIALGDLEYIVIAHEWRLEPDDGGCAIRLRVEIPAGEERWLAPQRVEMRSSMRRLVAAAEGRAAPEAPPRGSPEDVWSRERRAATGRQR